MLGSSASKAESVHGNDTYKQTTPGLRRQRTTVKFISPDGAASGDAERGGSEGAEAAATEAIQAGEDNLEFLQVDGLEVVRSPATPSAQPRKARRRCLASLRAHAAQRWCAVDQLCAGYMRRLTCTMACL